MTALNTEINYIKSELRDAVSVEEVNYFAKELQRLEEKLWVRKEAERTKDR